MYVLLTYGVMWYVGHGCCDVSYRTYWNNPKPNDEVKYVRFQQQRGYVDMWGLTYERP